MTRGTTLRATTTALLTGVATAVVAVLLGPAAPASAAPRSFDLYAVVGTPVPLPGATTPVKIWGYNDTNTQVTRPGGPTLVVNQGDEVTITLHNRVGEATGLLIQGQPMTPDLTGTPAGTDKPYTFTASEPGTYLYEAAPLPNAQHQVAMGLYGALVVRPTDFPLRAYADASTAFVDEAVLVLGEIDPALNNATNPATFDMRKYAPRYFLINGKPHPSTDAIAANAGAKLLLRYVNAGSQYHSMEVLGAHQSVIALDGSPLRDARRYVAETFGPGQTADAIVTAPASSVDVKMSLFDGSLLLHNTNQNTGGFGGMLAPINVTANLPAGGDTTGPITTEVAFAAGTLTATASDATRGGATVAAAEYFLDTVTATGTAMDATDGVFNSATEGLTSIPAPAVGSGAHVLYVRSQDSEGNWGPLSSAMVDGGDTGGPTTKFPSLTPSLTNHDSTAGVAVSATGDDSASGGSNILAAEYWIDGEPPETMTVNNAAPIASLDAIIPAATVNALPEGSRVVSMRSQDSQGNWGDPITINLSVDITPPTAGGLSVSPSPNNGLTPLSASVPAVRVIATTLSDPVMSGLNSAISRAEAFIDTVGANGSGIPLTASDGVFNDPSEGGYADIPLTTVRALSNGPHTISVHAKDAAGNWGQTSTIVLNVDKIAPTVSGLTVAPNPTQGAGSVLLSATATDSLSNIAAAEWFIGTDPGVGKATAFTSASGASPLTVSTTIDTSTMAEGTSTVRVRVKDAAGNWSSASSTSLTVTARLYYSTTGNANPPGVTGAADDADIYFWGGSAHSRSIDVSAAPYNLPNNANTDAFSRVNATQFYLSFSGNVNVPGVGTVADEDIVFYNNGVWSLWFDGSTHGLGGAIDVGAITIRGGTLYFSINNNSVPPGAGAPGSGDNADIYRWNAAAPGNSYTRVFDAAGPGSAGLPAGANVDGIVYIDATHLYLSFSGTNTTVPGLGAVQDEDVVYRSGTSWSVYFNGTAHGLTNDAHDIDAFDLP